MVRDPRPPKPHHPHPAPSEPDEAVELLRALARRRDAERPAPPSPAAPRREGEAFDSLRGIAERLDHQLRAPPAETAHAAPLREPSARRRAVHERPLDAPGAWGEFAAALPSARSLMPRLSPGRFIFVLISLVVLAIAAGGRLIGPRSASETPHAGSQPGGAPVPQSPLAERPSEIVPPLDMASVTKAMAACDEEAARNPSSLYFLVLPLIDVAPGKHDWRAVALQSVVNAYFLLSDKEALEGLRDKSLALRADRYTFAVLDPSTGISYSWTSATGLSRLSKPDVSAPKAIKLGFDFSAQQNGPQWSAPFNREPGTCYSVNVLVVQ
jgi:hypothetical protein